MDPIDEIIAGEPKPQTRKQAWASKGIPKDPHQAHKRIRASRKTRKSRVGNAALSGTFPDPLVQAVEAISDRHGVSRQAVMKRMFEDGVRKYGTQTELERAKLQKSTPFDEFQPLPDYDYSVAYDEPAPAKPRYAPRETPFPLVPSAGSPVGYQSVPQGEVLDEGTQDD